MADKKSPKFVKLYTRRMTSRTFSKYSKRKRRYKGNIFLQNMAENKLKFWIATFIGLLQLGNTTEFCDQKVLYLRLGSKGLVSCDFGTFRVIGWIIGEDVDDRSPFIYVENSRIQGPGYETGEYDMFQNGSLIINKVTRQHEQMFTARIVRRTDVEHYIIEVKVYVLPVPLYPVINGLINQQRVVIDDSVGLLSCAMDRVRPNIELELVFLDHVPQDVSLNSIHSSVNNTDGTYNVSLVSNLKVGSNLTGRLRLQCRVAGQMANYFPSVTPIDVLLLSNGNRQSYPTVNGMTNQQRVILDINREDELTCSWNGVSKPGYLKWDLMNPSSDQIIMTDHLTHTRDNGDGTYDLSLHSTLSVHNPSVFRVTVHCKVATPADQWYPEITTAELLLPANCKDDHSQSNGTLLVWLIVVCSFLGSLLSISIYINVVLIRNRYKLRRRNRAV